MIDRQKLRKLVTFARMDLMINLRWSATYGRWRTLGFTKEIAFNKLVEQLTVCDDAIEPVRA